MTRIEYNKAVDLHADNLYRFILKNIHDVEKTKDIVQETFLKVWDKRQDVAFEKVKSYMFTAAYRTMIDLIRREKKQSRMEEADLNKLTTSNQYSDLQQILHEALNQLPEIQKAVVLLRDYEGYNYLEIGEITGLTETQVKVYIYRARKFLQKFIGKIEVLI
ncbi:RNA polymerase sigma factor [Flavobacteriales bacterium]|nr:RNA polymerase sigma factor [Flavobacteriales bacterium]MDC3336377.1 RNA polymerase sigma factor [Flavobacteriales bacterium]